MAEKLIERIRALPIIYPIMIFFGYYNYDFYYKNLEIEIFNYLTVNELLFSFVSLITPVLIIIFCILVYLLLLYVLIIVKKSSENYSDVSDASSFSLIYNDWGGQLMKELRSVKKDFQKREYEKAITFLFFSVFFLMVMSLIKIFLWLFYYFFSFSLVLIILSMNEEKLEYYLFFNNTVSTSIFFFLWISISMAIIIHHKKENNLFNPIYPRLGILVLFLLSIITISQKRQIEFIEDNKPSSTISFTYEERRIFTNADIIFIGKTSDYMFLRNMKSKTNFIYNLSDIKHLEITKLPY